MIESLRARIEELEAQLRRNSSNSNKPPSTDPPWKPPKERRQRGQRKRGGQPGHGGHRRELVKPDAIVDVRPGACVHCGDGLAGDDPQPWRHQVTEVPTVAATVTEYRLHTLACAGCGQRTDAPWPEDVPPGAFGPRLQAIVAVCSGAYRLSKRNIVELVRDFFGVQICVGSICNTEGVVSEALTVPYQEAWAAVQKTQVVHADETGWFERSKLSWLWVAVTRTLAVFLIRKKRSKEVAQELLGKNFVGFLVTDQYQGYRWLSGRRRQLCWAHLIRTFRGWLEWPRAAPFARRLLDFCERMFAQWHQARDGTMLRSEFKIAALALQQELSALLAEGLQSPHPRVRGACKTLVEHEQSVWLFVRHFGVDPTNNRAERALRHAVIWRKTSFGTDSYAGSRFAERILTVIASLRLQGRNVLEYIAAACTARLRGSAPLSILVGA